MRAALIPDGGAAVIIAPGAPVELDAKAFDIAAQRAGAVVVANDQISGTEIGLGKTKGGLRTGTAIALVVGCAPGADDHHMRTAHALEAEPALIDARRVAVELEAANPLGADAGVFAGIVQRHPAGLAALAAMKDR